MFNFSFHSNIADFYDCVFEVYIEDKLVKRQVMQAPQEMLMMNFIQMAQQIRGDKRPMKIKIIRQEVVWDNFDNKERILNNDVAALNNAMIEWENNR